jgi:hypothetical protein
MVDAGCNASDILDFVAGTGLIAAPYSVLLKKAPQDMKFYVQDARSGYGVNRDGYGCESVGGFNGCGDGGHGSSISGDGHGYNYDNYGQSGPNGDGYGHGHDYGTADSNGYGEWRVEDGGYFYDPRIKNLWRWRESWRE